jgi:hypothetical protein
MRRYLASGRGRRRLSFAGAGTKEGTTDRFRDLNLTRVGIQARFFGGGGLIHAAVGLSGGIGALLTKRSGLVRNA